jgi:hypothetical protein
VLRRGIHRKYFRPVRPGLLCANVRRGKRRGECCPLTVVTAADAAKLTPPPGVSDGCGSKLGAVWQQDPRCHLARGVSQCDCDTVAGKQAPAVVRGSLLVGRIGSTPGVLTWGNAKRVKARREKGVTAWSSIVRQQVRPPRGCPPEAVIERHACCYLSVEDAPRASPRQSPSGRGSGCHRSSISSGRRAPRLISVRGDRAPVTGWWVGVPPRGGLPPLGLIGPDGTRAPAAVAAQEPAATSTTGETATRGERLIRRPAPGRRPPVPSACGSSVG